MTQAKNDTDAGLRDKARDAARQTADAIESNPLGVIVGGLALGAVVGALVPRSDREKELLAPLGKKIGAAATAALAAAKDTGRSELDNLGLNKGAAKDQAKTLLQNVAKAASTAGTAAVKAGKQEATGGNETTQPAPQGVGQSEPTLV